MERHFDSFINFCKIFSTPPNLQLVLSKCWKIIITIIIIYLVIIIKLIIDHLLRIYCVLSAGNAGV